MTEKITKTFPYFAWLIAWGSMIGSLLFSEIWHLPPCLLCWYQRILMYPLVVILGVGILTRDYKKLPYYVLPLSSMGMIVAVYHNLLYHGIIPQSLAPCTAGVSCTTKFFEWFDFVTIPFLSFFSFALITGIMIHLLLKNKKTPVVTTTEEKLLDLKPKSKKKK